MYKLGFFLMYLILLTGCRETYIREINFDAPAKLAMRCFITPGDTLIQVKLTRSVPVYAVNNNQSAINDAQVILEGNGQSYTLSFQPVNSQYSVAVSPSYIAEGQTYRLRVTHQNETVEASTTVPRAYALQGQASVSYILVGSVFGGGADTLYGCQANFNSAPWANSYYGISYQLNRRSNGIDYPGGYYSNSSNAISSMDFLKVEFASQNVGVRLNEKVRMNFRNPNQTNYFKIYVIQGDYAFYEFNRTADLNSRSDGEFFTEPVPIYSNVAGGLGCFGSYISYSFNSPEF